MARNVGVPVERIRFLATGVAVLLATFITSAVGVIGFIGLAAPALATFCGVQRFAARCLWSVIMGALLLLVTDLLVQLISSDGAFIPTGAVTAVIGSPLLLLLLSRLRSRQPQPPANEALSAFRIMDTKPRAPVLALLGAAVFLGLAALVMIGRGADGSWSILGGETLANVLPWRLPRMLAAAGAGGLLAIGGYILQRVTQNPLASPEIMGVSAGAIMGAPLPCPWLARAAISASVRRR